MKELAWEIAETHRAMRRYYDRRAAELGVTTAQWRVIAHVGHAPGLKQVELAERLDVEPITAGRIVDRLEESGLIARQPDPGDRRVWRLFLTEKAEPISGKLRDLAEEMADEAFAGFASNELQSIRDQLARVRENVGTAEAVQRKSA
jgi:DNA-binding MarR family transcriptional regulator